MPLPRPMGSEAQNPMIQYQTISGQHSRKIYGMSPHCTMWKAVQGHESLLNDHRPDLIDVRLPIFDYCSANWRYCLGRTQQDGPDQRLAYFPMRNCFMAAFSASWLFSFHNRLSSKDFSWQSYRFLTASWCAILYSSLFIFLPANLQRAVL